MVEEERSTKKIKCTCKHAYQDKRYNGFRVYNKTAKGYRCTVCKKEV